MIQITKKIEGDSYYVHENNEPSFGITLTYKQLEEFYLEACRWLFDNILEQNKDMLIRLRNNEPAPKLLNSDKVIEWLNDQACCGWIEDIEVAEFVKRFKRDFNL